MTAVYNMSLIMSMTSGGSEISNSFRQLGCGPMAAARHINDGVNTVVPTLLDLVPSGTVDARMYDSELLETSSIEAYREGLANGGQVFVGAARSAVTTILSMLAGVDDIPGCSYWSSSPALSNKALYPTFGRTYPSDAVTTQALPQLIAQYGWSSIAVVHTNDAYANAYAEGACRPT